MSELRGLVGRRVFIQVAGEDTIAGTVDRAGKQTLTLSGATAHAGDSETPIDGEVVVMLQHVTWLQAV